MLFNVEGLDLTAWRVWKLVIHTQRGNMYTYIYIVTIY